jgi:hypothetical protein
MSFSIASIYIYIVLNVNTDLNDMFKLNSKITYFCVKSNLVLHLPCFFFLKKTSSILNQLILKNETKILDGQQQS